MIMEFDDFCTWVFVVVDAIWKTITPLFKRPGLKPECADSNLIAMSLIGECRGWHMETDLLRYWKEYRHLFPRIPSQSRFNRRRRNMMHAIQIHLRTIPRSNQKEQASETLKHLRNAIHQFNETVNEQLSGQFAIEKNYAHIFWGLCTRLFSKLTEHTLCIYINRSLGKPGFLQIKPCLSRPSI